MASPQPHPQPQPQPQPQPPVLRHANTTPSQPLTHQRSMVRKPVGQQSTASTPSPQSISLAHRPAPHLQQQQQQQQQQQHPPNDHNPQQQFQQTRPQSFHPGQQSQYPAQQQPEPQYVQPINQSVPLIQSVQQIPAQPLHYPQQQQQHQVYSHPHHQPFQQPFPPQQIHQQPYQQQSPLPQQQSPLPQQHTQQQHPQQQPFSPTSPLPHTAHQTTPQAVHQTQASPASPTPQLHRVDTGNSNINQFTGEHGRPASISSSSAGIATPATAIASSAASTPRWEPNVIPQPMQQAPAVEVRRIPLNVPLYTCLICSTAHIATSFCVWCFTSNAAAASHGHDKSYYATESDPRVQPSVQDAIAHMWTIRKNVSGRLWYHHNTTGLKTHIKPTAAALSGFSGLPPGWDERKTPDGKTFYFNQRMGTSSWGKPSDSLPEGWKELRTPDLAPFYVNEQLGLSTWDRPGQQPRQPIKQPTKQNTKAVVKRTRSGQPTNSQNVGENILSATINATKLTGRGVEIASRQVGKLGKKKNWKKMGRMLNQVHGFPMDGSGSDGEGNDYEDGGDSFGGESFGGEDASGYQDQGQEQYQQSFDYQQTSYSEQPQQSFAFEDNQQQTMFQQPAYEQQQAYGQQQAYEYPMQPGQPAYGQQQEQFSVTAEVSYPTGEPQPCYEQQQDPYGQQQAHGQQPGSEFQQQPAFEPVANQEPVAIQQPATFEPIHSQYQGPPPHIPQEPYVPPPQLTPQAPANHQVPAQQVYTAQPPVVYEPAPVPQQQVIASCQVPGYAPKPTPVITAQAQIQVQQPVYPAFMPNNQPKIITNDVPLVEVPCPSDNTHIFVGDGYQNNDILAGTSLAAEDGNAITPQDNFTVEVTFQHTPEPEWETASPAPLVIREYNDSPKSSSFVSVEAVQAEGGIDASGD
ncbi:hypothetical protein F66182_6752 [Fusarium sp. NRRL 66182]|nr:hypothetical protein F66182_6752 [Fusarium sp. NRRL 66182]